MKNLQLFIFFLICMIGSGVQAQTRLYVNPQFSLMAKDHQVIAVVPFKTSVSLRPNQMREMKEGDLEKMEKAESKGIQAAMYSWFLQRQESGKMWVKVQDINTTNAMLLKAGIEYENIENYPAKELANILGVDAVVSGTFQTNKPMSEGAGVALALLVGFYGSTNNAVVNMFINDRETGEVLVNYHKGLSGSIGSTTDQLINILMRKASRRIPYTKARA
jgi:hypothetical protein